jgi:hypothetical protein
MGQLHQGQVKFVDYILPDSGPLSTFKSRVPTYRPQYTTNNNYYPVVQPASSVPSDGGDCGKTTKYEDHNHGCRDESPDDWVQNSNSFEYSGTFKIPNARDQLTFEFAGKPHTSGNSRDGYKVAFDESATGGVFLWKQVGEKYKGPFTRFPYSVKPGQVVTIKIAKQNIGPESNPIGVEIRAYADGAQIGKWRDMDSNRLAGIIPYYAIPGSRYGYRHDGLNGTTTSCPDNKKIGPSVYCGLGTPMQIRTLPNLSA